MAASRARTSAVLLAAALAWLATAPSAGAVTVSSTFDSHADGWTVSGDCTGGCPSFVAAGGNPGGHISAQDGNTGVPMYWEAPAKFEGDKGVMYDGDLSFALRQSTTENQVTANDDVILSGAGLTLRHDLPNPTASHFLGYQLRLGDIGWVDAATSQAATAEQMQSVLDDLTRLAIRAEYTTQAETDYLDTVVMESLPSFVYLGDPPSAREGERLRFTVTVDASADPITVQFETRDGTAKAGKDYRAKAGSLEFASGITEQTVRVRTFDDSRPEERETLLLALTSAEGAEIYDSQVEGKIRDND